MCALNGCPHEKKIYIQKNRFDCLSSEPHLSRACVNMWCGETKTSSVDMVVTSNQYHNNIHRIEILFATFVCAFIHPCILFDLVNCC